MSSSPILGVRRNLRRDLLATTAVTLALALAATGAVLAQAYNAGTGSSAGGTNATALGPNASGGGDESFAGGYNADASGAGAVAIGTGSSAQSAASGQGIIDYRNTSGVGSAGAGSDGNINNGSTGTLIPYGETGNAIPSGTAIGKKSTVGSSGGVAVGYNNAAGTGGYSSTAIGTNNNAPSRYGVAIGNGNVARGRSSTTIGTANQANGDSSIALGRESYATGDNSIAQGFVASAYGRDGIALGRLSVAGEAGDGTGNGSTSGNVAIGDNTQAAGGWATAIGSGAAATAVNALALGRNAAATQDGGVALGFGSMALRGGMNGASEDFSGTAVSSTVGAVSVGAAGAERQITNLAGGTQDTDAVNVRQLRGLGNTLGTTLGATFNPGTNAYTAPSYAYGGTTYNTVPGIVGALDTFALRYDRDSTGNRLASIDLTRGGTAGSAVSITGLAPATTDSGAVALSQMPLRYSTAASPTTANPAVPSNNVTLVGSNTAQSVALHNVGAGTLASGSTDAVNGGQLYATNQDVTALKNGGAGLVRQANGSAPITVGAATGGTAVDLTGTQGARRLTGLANGTGDGDGATIGQLRLSGNALASGLGGGSSYDPVTGAFTAPSYAVGGRTYGDVGSALAATNVLAVQYVPDAAGAPTSVVDLARNGGGPVALRGVAAGNIASGSTDAVNGGQLYTTNQNVADLQNGRSGLVRQATGTDPITVGANTAGGAVSFSDNAGGARVLRGVAAGAVAAGSTEAVNGGQLYALGQQVGSNYDAVANGTVGLVQQDPTTRTITVGPTTDGRLIDFTGTQGTRRLAGLASGIGDSDAATIGQLRLAGRFAADALGGGASFDPSTGTSTAPSYAVGGRTYNDVGSALAATNGLSVQYVADGNGGATNVVDLARGGGAPVTLRGVAAGAVAANSTDAVNGGQLYTVTQNIADLQNGTAGLVRQDPVSRTITVGGSTDGTSVSFANQAGAARTLTGVSAGQIVAGSTQGVNGGQVYAVTASVASALGGGAGVAPDGALTAPGYAIQGTTYDNVGGALGSLDAAVTNLNTNGSRYVAVHSTGAAAQALGADTVAVGPAAIASANRGVALGAGAVASRAGMAGAREVFSGISVASTQGAVSVGAAGAERQITNLAGGTQDTDAINLRQLRTVGGNLAGALGGGAGFAADGSFTAPSYAVGGQRYASVGAALDAVDTFGVRYDVDPASGGRGQSITLAGGDPNQPVLIRNVAAGVLPTDVANVGQVAQAKAEANAYTDRSVAASYAASTAYTDAAVAPLQKQMTAFGGRLNDLTRQVGEVRSEARRGAAIGLAAGSLRFDDRPGKLSVAAGGGAWRGEAAASFGVGYTLPDGSARVNATGVAAGRDFGIGAGASFTLN